MNNNPWASIKIKPDSLEISKKEQADVYKVNGRFEDVEILSNKEFYDNVEKWAKVRGIDSTDTINQTSKLIEETGELFTAVLEKDTLEMLDAVGDARVVATIAMLQLRTRNGEGMTMGEIESLPIDENKITNTVEQQMMYLGSTMGEVISAILRGDLDKYSKNIAELLAMVDNVLKLTNKNTNKAYSKYLTAEYAQSLAWNEIKDRQGMVIDDVFVKWADLTEEQREEFKRREVK